MKEEWKEYLNRYMAENSSWNLEKGLLLLAMKSMAEAEDDEGCVPPLLNAAKNGWQKPEKGKNGRREIAAFFPVWWDVCWMSPSGLPVRKYTVTL